MRSRPRISMREALADPLIFGPIMSGSSWHSWRTLLVAACGEPLTEDEREEFKRLTHREHESGQPIREFVAIAGRRAGKSTAMCILAIWIACLCDHRGTLAAGEVGIVLMVSRDQRVSKMLLDRIAEIMLLSEPLASMIVNRTQDTLELQGNVRIELRPASSTNLRSPTYLCILADEVAFWFTSTDFANPDTEVLAAAKPGLLTTGGPLVMISSAYSQHGVLYEAWRQYFGPAGPPDILVAHATSRDLNPSLDQAEIDRAIERDPVRNRAEYLSEFRSDVSGLVPREVIMANVGDYLELPPHPGTAYRCFIDQASGVPDGDSFAIAISHKYGSSVVVDLVREVRPPFSPASVVNDVLVPLCKSYNVHSVSSDNYAAGFAQNLIFSAGLAFTPATKHKSELYLELLPLLNSQRISLPSNERLIDQIAGLERSTMRSGRDAIDHGPHSHDDVVNAVAGAADLAYNFTLFDFSYGFVDGNPLKAKSPAEVEAERRRQNSDYDNYYELCRKFGQPPPCPPWGIPRSKSPEQEQRESDENARWRIAMYLGMVR